MKSLLPALTGIVLLVTPAFAQDASADDAAPAAAATPDPNAKLKDLVGRINEKLSSGSAGQIPDLKPEIEEFDKLRASFKEGEEEAAAQATIMEAMLFLQVLGDTPKGTELIKELQAKYPDTEPGKKAESILAAIEKQEASKGIRESLKVGTEFPNFEVTDLDGKPLSVAAHKGKVVLIDFWATWCGPCVNELPNVIAAYDKYHDKGFDIIGVSLDQDKDALTKFIAEKKMAWPQYFDGKGWDNAVSTKYGISSIPATFLLDKDGKIIGTDLRGEALDKAVAKALGSES